MPWNIKPFLLIHKPVQVRRTEHKTKAGASTHRWRIAFCRVAANTPGVKLTIWACSFGQAFSDSDALAPHWWLPGENLHFKSFTDAIASANFSSDSGHWENYGCFSPSPPFTDSSVLDESAVPAARDWLCIWFGRGEQAASEHEMTDSESAWLKEVVSAGT